MMKEQIDKEIRSLQEKKKKLKERDKAIADQKAELMNQSKNMELYSSENNFNILIVPKDDCPCQPISFDNIVDSMPIGINPIVNTAIMWLH